MNMPKNIFYRNSCSSRLSEIIYLRIITKFLN